MHLLRDPLGAAIIRLTAESDACRHGLRKAVHKLLPECPAAIIIDLSETSQVSRLVQTTLLSLAIEAGQEPATPLGFCALNAEVARELAGSGPTLRVFPTVAKARQALMTSVPVPSWIHRALGSGPGAPTAAAAHVDEACLLWRLAQMNRQASTAAFHLASLARGPYELHLTVSLRGPRRLLINVRNYSTAAASSPERYLRQGLKPIEEAVILAHGATACGRMVNGAGVAWWAMLDGRAPESA
jgi:anti-anti-sigma regulatory factor